MNSNHQSALAALRTVEPIAAKLDRARDGEDRAADILELWQGTETALRALIGGSSLSGQGLIRELRQRELISLGQAYALLEFLGARDRANRTTYHATDNDVVVAREGYRQLEAGIVAAAAAEAEAPPPAAAEPPPRTESPYAPPPAPASGTTGLGGTTSAGVLGAAGMRSSTPPPPPPGYTQAPVYGDPVGAPADTAEPTYKRPRRLPPNTWFIAALAMLILASIAGYALFATRSDPEKEMNEAVAMLQSGRREAAKGQFATIARENPELATPHVFLSRLAREEGDLSTARRELETAIRLEPTNYVALREMGLILFSAGNYEVAKNFFVRAIKNNPNDKASQGYLGCALARLNRFQEAQGWVARAGPGSWSSCLPQRPL